MGALEREVHVGQVAAWDLTERLAGERLFHDQDLARSVSGHHVPGKLLQLAD
jgi:hypothetical protein